jgi:predicted O-methyltransferase YrrM
MFEELVWKDGQMILDDLVFQVDEGLGAKGLRDGMFRLVKSKRMIEQYARFWNMRKDFAPSNILELGIYEGASIVFWFEFFRPVRLVGIDISRIGNSVPLQRYLELNELQDRIGTHWETSQTDLQQITQILSTDFSGPLDLVFDDASHVYQFTRVSFEALFPRLRPGGLYIIEDWSWAQWSSLAEDYNPSGLPLPAKMSRDQIELTRLVAEIAIATGKMEGFLSEVDGFVRLQPLIGNVQVFPDFVVVERGPATLEPGQTLDLTRFLPRRRAGRFRRVLRRATGLSRRHT